MNDVMEFWVGRGSDEYHINEIAGRSTSCDPNIRSAESMGNETWRWTLM